MAKDFRGNLFCDGCGNEIDTPHTNARHLCVKCIKVEKENEERIAKTVDSFAQEQDILCRQAFSVLDNL